MSKVVTEAANLLNGSQPPIEIVKSKIKKSIKSRTVLWHVTFWGFVVNYMVRCNINMAIVSMVIPRIPTNRSAIRVSECFNHSLVSLLQNDSHSKSDDDHNGFRIERNIMDLFKVIFYILKCFFTFIVCLSSVSQQYKLKSLLIFIISGRFTFRLTIIKKDLSGMNISKA